MTPRNNGRARLLVMLAGLLVMLLGATWLFGRQHLPTVSMKYSRPVPGIFNEAGATNNGVVVFSGDGFLVVNDRGIITKTLDFNGENPGVISPDSLSMSSSDGGYVLFHQDSVATGTDLYNTLVAHGFPTNTDYWWVYSAGDRSLQPLASGTLLAKLDGSRVVGLSLGDAGESLQSYTLPGVVSGSSINIPNASDFLPVKDGFLLETAKGDILFTTNGVVNTTVASSSSLVGVVGDGSTAILIANNKKSQDLTLLDVATRETATIAHGVGSTVAVNPSGVVLFSQLDSTGSPEYLATYETSTKTTTRLDAGKFDKSTPAIILDANTIIVVSQDQTYSIVSRAPVDQAIETVGTTSAE